MVAAQKAKRRFWINNGRVNAIWQTGYHERYDAAVHGAHPMSLLEMSPEDARSLGVSAGDIVELYNDFGSTRAMAHLEPSIKPGQVFMQFGYENGVQGNVTTSWTDRNIIPYYKGTWADIRRAGKSGAEKTHSGITLKSRLYGAG